MLMDEILDHTSDDTAVRKGEGLSVDMNGRKRRKYTTKGWNLLVSWKDRTQSWIPLKDTEESYPIELAEYMKAKELVI